MYRIEYRTHQGRIGVCIAQDKTHSHQIIKCIGAQSLGWVGVSEIKKLRMLHRKKKYE